MKKYIVGLKIPILAENERAAQAARFVITNEIKKVLSGMIMDAYEIPKISESELLLTSTLVQSDNQEA